MLLGACNSDVGGPTGLAPSGVALSRGAAHSNPGNGNNKVLAPGETEVYVFTILPGEANELSMGTPVLEMPAWSVCAAGSGYGTGTWDKPCTAETKPVTITATVIGTSTYPRVDFEPAMRFNPASGDVQLFMFARHASSDAASKFSILYCSGVSQTHCDDEAKHDPTLVTQFSKRGNEVFRRIRHFSGYVVAENDGTPAPGLQ
jgi:hypothetical protein